MTEVDGPVPVADLAPGASAAVREFLGRATSPGCDEPSLLPPTG